ncbi:SSI family serine proteinase inhibitor [Nocardiopsis sp. EMB25]|uniref:SSI family serine proteinase inhibitor n=1 Tax=Nocardiopsis TaxID=2013 RepID=UPI00034C46BA|nr:MULTISPECIES: SSI family serine proteinase inhibitor [Nocardiopsis]MCY9787383.1 SSI family serine proteinase inhibitor [Nocardiopsis sp. EMB25]
MRAVTAALAACAATAIALVPAAPAAAEVPAADPPAHPVYRAYRLQVVEGVGFEDESVREVSLVCAPKGGAGSHPRAADACAAIARAGSIKAVPADPAAACTLEYRPVIASARGSENYRAKFGNTCLLHAAKGVVFDF